MGWLADVDRITKQYTSLGLWAVAVVVVLAAAAGAGIGIVFPKFQATAMLQFPVAPRPNELRPDDKNPDKNTVDLALYKRVAAAYASEAQLKTWLDASGAQTSAAAARLVAQSSQPRFWDDVATPVLPFSRRDQREFGDVKDASANALLGVDLVADARTAETARQMVDLLGAYFSNAVIRERVRAWVQAGKADSSGTVKIVQADLVKAELDIQLLERRTQDMKTVLTRYPDAARMDARQLISVNTEAGERFLSPLAQLVGFESAVSQKRETIRRLEREFQQKRLLSAFYDEAEKVVDANPAIGTLLTALKRVAEKHFAGAETSQEWAREAALRVQAALDNFTVLQSQFGVRNGVRLAPAPNRSPVRLAVLLAVVVTLAIGTLAFLRAALRTSAAGAAKP